jgi:hypothetical protein
MIEMPVFQIVFRSEIINLAKMFQNTVPTLNIHSGRYRKAEFDPRKTANFGKVQCFYTDFPESIKTIFSVTDLYI